MSKNILIGTLAIILLVGIGYLIYKNGAATPSNINFQASSTEPVLDGSNAPGTSGGVSSNTAPARTPAAAIVQTDSTVILSNTTAVVSGKVNPNGAPAVYWYEYGLTGNLGSRTSNQNIGSGYNAITSPGYITGLKQKTQYYFRLNAQNAYGVTHGETYSFITTDNVVAPQAAAPTVQTGAATNVSRDSSTINGKVNPRGYATSYWFEFGETSSLGNLTGFESLGNNGQSLVSVSAPLSNLKPLTKYYYRLNAQNQFGTVNGVITSFTTLGPAPATVGAPIVKTNAATNVSTSSVTFNGRLDPNGADTVYWFEYSKDSLLGRVVGTATADQTMAGDDAAIGVKADVSGLSRNTKYFYRMLARNSYGTVIGEVVSFRTR